MRTTALLSVLCLAALPAAFGQYYNISTVAGNGRIQLSGLGGPAVSATLVSPRAVAADSAGNVYFSETYFNQVLRIGLDGSVNVLAGNSTLGFSGDNGPAASAQLNNPGGIAVDPSGNVYIADTGNSRIRKVTPAGVISTIAGDGRTGKTGDGGPGISAEAGGVFGLALDAAGNLYFSQSGQNVVRVLRTDGTVAAVAGTGTASFSGDEGPATSATLSSPGGIAVDAQGNLFIADTRNNRIRKVTPAGTISTVVGTGLTQFNNDGIQALVANLAQPGDVAVDSANNLYIADTGAGRLRRVNAAGIITTLAGGTGAGGSFLDGPGVSANLPSLNSIALDNQGRVLLSVNAARQIRRLNGDLTVQTVGGVLPSADTSDGAEATATPLLGPSGVAVDRSGSFYVTDVSDHRVRKISSNGTIATVAGNGIFGNTGDNGSPTDARLGSPVSIFYRPNGDVLVGIGAGATIRKIAAGGLITTVAGGNGAGFSGDNGPAIAARFIGVSGLVADAAGNIFISDRDNNRIRRVDAITGTVSTIAGTGIAGFSGDGGPATAAQLNIPWQLTFDSQGSLYVADTSNHRVRKIDQAGVITTVAGTGTVGTSGDNGPATAALLTFPTGIAFDAKDNLYLTSGNTVRKVDATTGIISRIAGGNGTGFSGDGALATNAQLATPLFLTVDESGAVYLSDSVNKRVRKLTPAQIVPEGTVNSATSKVGGVAPGEIITIYGFDLGPSSPAFLRLDASGKVATELGGTQVFFDGIPAPVIYSSQGQVNVIVPYAVSGSTMVQVVYQGKTTNTMTLPVVPTSPGFFAITNENGSVNAASNRADRGSVLVFYGTGEGQTSPAGVDGAVSTSVFPKPIAPVSVKIGGQTAEILYAGAAPGFVSGVLQVNVRIPAGVTGSVPLEVTFGTGALPTGTQIHVK